MVTKMNEPEKDNITTENTALTLLKAEKPAEEPKLRHLTDDEIIRGFKYLMNKDRKDK